MTPHQEHVARLRETSPELFERDWWKYVSAKTFHPGRLDPHRPTENEALTNIYYLRKYGGLLGETAH